MVRRTISRFVPIFAATAGVLALSACGGGSTPTAQTSTSSSPSSTESPTATATSAASNSESTTKQPAAGTAQADGLCKAGDVKLSLGQGDAGAGSQYRPLLITNIKPTPCTIQGFPGVSYVAGADGHQVGPAAFREGTKGNAVKLNQNQSAAADLQFVNVQNFDPAVCKPTEVTGLRIYLPQETASNFLPAPGTGCSSDKIPGNQLSVKTVHVA